MNDLRVIGLNKSFGPKQVLSDISFTTPSNSVTGIMGPSGCGKSTLLKIIAGLIKPDSGSITWGHESIIEIPPHRRRFGLMFQDYALFPHLTVYKNIAFGLEVANSKPDLIKQRVLDSLALVGLSGFEKRDISTLSGGEAQRVALARTLAPQPVLLMLDEPFGSLDRNLRDRLIDDLRSLHEQLQLTTLYVTHDQEEAFSLADQVIVMDSGKIIQKGKPFDIFHSPANAFVANFLGMHNILSGKGIGNQIETHIGTIPWENQISGEMKILLRPNSLRLDHTAPYQMVGYVSDVSFKGGYIKMKTIINDIEFSFDFPPNVEVPELGKSIDLSIDPRKAIQILSE